MNQITSPVTASPVPDRQRLNFWPKHFGKISQWMLLEPRAFAWMDRLCEAYNGGYWNYYTLSNGGAFIAPDSEDNRAMFNKLNGNCAEMSSEAAGIAVCLLNWSHHACRTDSPAMSEHYYRLREFALSHPESSVIMHIID
ncbi:antirestriction protein [Enterobacter sp. DN]|uniref:antirestriction protein n=1 Tax=Enterobacteriaceae TaxID=543 RepID=UPI002ABABC49|nr:antirestriction protein [Klebsiella aerogenes]WVJ31877.1 antirestriction protein [Klebsiella aerogenes]